ncbi:hypothetical protein GCM10027451_43020 [Geodermatophilus aquaeductus]
MVDDGLRQGADVRGALGVCHVSALVLVRWSPGTAAAASSGAPDHDGSDVAVREAPDEAGRDVVPAGAGDSTAGSAGSVDRAATGVSRETSRGRRRGG